MSTDEKMVIDILNNMNTRNSKILASFVQYCLNSPDLRFWQALLNWSSFPYLFVATDKPIHHNESLIWREHEISDPYNWEDKNGRTS